MWVSSDICLKFSIPKFYWANTYQWWRTEESGSDTEDYGLIDKNVKTDVTGCLLFVAIESICG